MSTVPSRQGPSNSGSVATVIFIILTVLGVIVVGILACVGVAAAMLLPAVTSARNAAEKAMFKNNLRQLGVAYFMYQENTPDSAGPSSWEDLSSGDMLDPTVADELRHSGLNVIWAVRRVEIDRSSIPSFEIVLAYEKRDGEDDQQVLHVLMADGAVVEMTSAEIQDHVKRWEAEQRPPRAEFE